MTERSTPWLTTKRVESLTDGVFAIAMTLLVLNLRVPVISEDIAKQTLPGALLSLRPHFFAYGLSFFLLAVFWIIHHRQFHTIKRADQGLLWINIVALIFIVLLPFSTSLIGEYENVQLAAIFFEGNLLAAGLAFYFNYWYATANHRLVDPDLDERAIVIGRRRNLVIPVVSLVAIGLSFVSPQYSTLAYALIPFILAKYLKS